MLSSGLKPKGDGEEDQCWPAGENTVTSEVGAMACGGMPAGSKGHPE